MRHARRLLVAADREHDDVRHRGHLHRLGDLATVLVGVARDDDVLGPRAADGDLAAFRVDDLRGVADACRDARENRLVVGRHTAIAAEQAAVRVRPDDGDRAELSEIEREEVAVVPEQRDGLARGVERELAIPR